MKALALSFASVAFMSLVLNSSCGSKDDDKEETAATSTYTYTANTKTIIDANCIDGGCHNSGSVNKGLTTLAEVKAMGPSKMITRIQATDSSVMPQNDQSWKNTDDAKILLDWLAGGADLK
jgi:hypothetical protein